MGVAEKRVRVKSELALKIPNLRVHWKDLHLKREKEWFLFLYSGSVYYKYSFCLWLLVCI
jgi:hypothetical protein